MTLRAACKNCNSLDGKVETKTGQDVVRCANCDRYQYCQPKTESGRLVRSVQTTRKSIKPSQRDRIIERANCRCERCGKPAHKCATGLHVGHVISIEEGFRHQVSDELLHSDENLIAECDECNLGHSSEVLPVRLLVAILQIRKDLKNGG